MRAWAAALLVGAVLVVPAAGQSVVGTVVDADQERPVRRARVVLLDSALVPFDSTRTDAEGRFRIAAPGAGEYVLLLYLDGYLSVNASVRVEGTETVVPRIEMPLLSVAAARVMGEAIDRESALQLPLDELCREPLRPWEAGVLVGVTRDRRTLQPVAEVLVTLEPGAGEAAEAPATFSRLSTDNGTYWFCNVPAGRARLVARGDPGVDTSWVTIRAGTISWSDALLRRR